MGKPQKLGDLKGKDLAGYQFATAYLLKIDHGLMGFHPALVSESDEPVVCLTKKLLKEVWKRLPRRKAKVVEITILTNSILCFHIDDGIHPDRKPLPILTEEDFERLTQGTEPFVWAPGVVYIASDIDIPDPFGE